jgi:prepilin peptidase CpaA
MGDIKLAAAIGSLFGPPLASLAMMVSMFIGGLMALTYAVRENDLLRSILPRFPLRRKAGLKKPPERLEVHTEDVECATLPYGVAIALGTLLSLLVCQWTGFDNWLFFLRIAAATR